MRLESHHDTRNRPLHDLRISVTDRCNLRCTYCMPKERFGEKYAFMPREELLTFEEIVRVARAAAQLGVRKLRITGGEPLLRKSAPDLVAMLREVEGIEDIALTTNGLLLPGLAASLKSAGLDRLTVSLDSLDADVFGQMNGLGEDVARVHEGIAAAEAAGFGALKINVVVQRGVNDHGAVQLAERFRGTGHIVRFIEYMDVGTLNHWDRSGVVPSAELLARIGARFPLRPVASNYPGEVAERYVYEDGAGELGFISSVTQPFCGACSRLRLSADGAVFTCLFATHGTDIRSLLRAGATDNELCDSLAGVWMRRADRYSEIRATVPRPADRVEMYHIGG
jgi:cyclic pyranopterin phosphate synthase